MANKNDIWMNASPPNGDDLDHVLDAALEKYASLEPRPGLEERMLANLRAADGPVAHRVLWTRGSVGALAAVILVAVMVLWRLSIPIHPRIANHPLSTQQTQVPDRVTTQRRPAASQQKNARKIVRNRTHNEVIATIPKLEVFPSRLPLSEQEKILASYVAQYPEHAALVAEACMDALREQDEERRRITAGADSKQ